jgi:hypothetical protein
VVFSFSFSFVFFFLEKGKYKLFCSSASPGLAWPLWLVSTENLSKCRWTGRQGCVPRPWGGLIVLWLRLEATEADHSFLTYAGL